MVDLDEGEVVVVDVVVEEEGGPVSQLLQQVDLQVVGS